MDTVPADVTTARYVLELARDEELVDWAVAAMSAGGNGQALNMLAGLVVSERSDARELFGQALGELNRSLPSKRTAVMLLAREIAGEMVQGRTAPEAGAATIWDLTILAHPEHLGELDTFVYAASEWPERPELREELAKRIKEAAAELASRRGD